MENNHPFLNNLRIAVLIDSDNADGKLIESMLNEISKHGRVTIKRAYADWTKPNGRITDWKDRLNEFAIRPMQKFEYTVGKNSTDGALIIDAMDVLWEKLVDGFCIVSSDSDYTGLANRIREEGLFVMGIGKSHTPTAFVKACNNFVYEEILKTTEKEKTVVIESKEGVKKLQPETPILKGLTVLGKVQLTNLVTKKPININLVNQAFEQAANEISGFAYASQFKDALQKIDPSFDHRNYGFTAFSKFLEALKPDYEVTKEKDGFTVTIKRSTH